MLSSGSAAPDANPCAKSLFLEDSDMLRGSPRAQPAWAKLTPDAIRQIAARLHPGDVAASLKLINKEAAACLREYRVIQLDGKPETRWPARQRPAVAASCWPAGAFVITWSRPEAWSGLTLRKRRRLLCLAAASGHLPSLEVALANCGSSAPPEALAAAAASGHVPACALLHQREGVKCEDDAAVAAAEAGHLPMLQWMAGQGLLHQISQWSLKAAAAACRAGQTHIVDWLDGSEILKLSTSSSSVISMLAASAAEGGHVALLERLLAGHTFGHDGSRSIVLRGIAAGCPAPLLRRYCVQWRALDAPEQHGPVFGVGQQAFDLRSVFVRALGSATPDWRDKCDYLLSARPATWYCRMLGQGDVFDRVVEARWDYCGQDYSLAAAAAQPDFEQRLRYLQAAAWGAAAAAWPQWQHAAEAAAGYGNAAALLFLLDECGVPQHQQQQQLRSSAAQIAARAGHQHILDLLLQRRLSVFGSHPNLRSSASAWPADVLQAVVQVSVECAAYDRSLVPVMGHQLWSTAFTEAAKRGADDAGTLVYLHEERGAPLDLGAVAAGGSVEQLQWALGRLRRADSSSSSGSSGAGSRAGAGPSSSAKVRRACGRGAGAGRAGGDGHYAKWWALHTVGAA